MKHCFLPLAISIMLSLLMGGCANNAQSVKPTQQEPLPSPSEEIFDVEKYLGSWYAGSEDGYDGEATLYLYQDQQKMKIDLAAYIETSSPPSYIQNVEMKQQGNSFVGVYDSDGYGHKGIITLNLLPDALQLTITAETNSSGTADIYTAEMHNQKFTFKAEENLIQSQILKNGTPYMSYVGLPLSEVITALGDKYVEEPWNPNDYDDIPSSISTSSIHYIDPDVSFDYVLLPNLYPDNPAVVYKVEMHGHLLVTDAGLYADMTQQQIEEFCNSNKDYEYNMEKKVGEDVIYVGIPYYSIVYDWFDTTPQATYVTVSGGGMYRDCRAEESLNFEQAEPEPEVLDDAFLYKVNSLPICEADYKSLESNLYNLNTYDMSFSGQIWSINHYQDYATGVLSIQDLNSMSGYDPSVSLVFNYPYGNIPVSEGSSITIYGTPREYTTFNYQNGSQTVTEQCVLVDVKCYTLEESNVVLTPEEQDYYSGEYLIDAFGSGTCSFNIDFHNNSIDGLPFTIIGDSGIERAPKGEGKEGLYLRFKIDQYWDNYPTWDGKDISQMPRQWGDTLSIRMRDRRARVIISTLVPNGNSIRRISSIAGGWEDMEFSSSTLYASGLPIANLPPDP